MIDEQPDAHPVRDETARSQWVSTPRHWVITAVVIGALMLLATWPLPTLIGLGVTAVGGFLLGGICAVLGRRAKVRRCGGECAEGHTFLGQCEQADDEAGDGQPERCCVCGSDETPYENYRGQLFCWPCANCPCGQDGCVRTGINAAAGSSPADGPLTGAGTDGSEEEPGDRPTVIEPADGAQAGDDTADAGTQPSGAPDANVEQLDEQQLRDDIATALITRIKQSFFVDSLPGMIGQPFAATEYDLADVVLTVVRPHLATPAAQREAEAVTEVWRANAELAVGQRDQARAAIARVRAIKKAPGRSAVNHYANIQDDAWDEALDEVRAALDGPAVQVGADQPAEVTGPDGRPAGCTCASTAQVLLGHHRGCPCHLPGRSAEVDQSGPTAADVVQDAPEQPVSDPQPVDDPARVVAYRSLGGRILRCLAHAPTTDLTSFYRVTAEDLPDGGICTLPDCGRDVLIPATPRVATDGDG